MDVNNYRRVLNPNHTIKIILLGSTNVGKTSISMRMCEDVFLENNVPTIAAEFFIIKHKFEDCTLNIQMWDTAGQEKFRSLMPMYYRDTDVAIFVFDVTDKDSLERVKENMNDFKNSVHFENTILYVVGNKIDNKYTREVESSEANNYSILEGAKYFETSAKTKEGIDYFYKILINDLLEKHKGKFLFSINEKESNPLMVINSEETSDFHKRKMCCAK